MQSTVQAASALHYGMRPVPVHNKVSMRKASLLSGKTWVRRRALQYCPMICKCNPTRWKFITPGREWQLPLVALVAGDGFRLIIIRKQAAQTALSVFQHRL